MPDSDPRSNYNSYILGPGDGLQIELLDLPELSGISSIGPDGILYLPRLRALHVDGLTVKELRQLLTQQFSAYVRDPEVYIRPVIFRPVRIYVSGEVGRPGYYTVSKETDFTSIAYPLKIHLGPMSKIKSDPFSLLSSMRFAPPRALLPTQTSPRCKSPANAQKVLAVVAYAPT